MVIGTDYRGSYKSNYDHDGPCARTDYGLTSVNHCVTTVNTDVFQIQLNLLI